MKLKAIVCLFVCLLCSNARSETKTVVLLGDREGSDEPLVVDVASGQVLEILGYSTGACLRWEVDFGNGVVIEHGTDELVPVLAGPLQLRVTNGCKKIVVSYRLSQNTPFPSKASPVLTKLSLEGPTLTTEYSVAPGFVYSLSRSPDLLVWEKLSDHLSKDGKLSISQQTSDESNARAFFKLE